MNYEDYFLPSSALQYGIAPKYRVKYYDYIVKWCSGV